jgi:beta-glucosidase-like glycosyl hydrolase
MSASESGRLIMPALRWRESSGYAHEHPTITAALERGAGGFIIFGGPAFMARALATDLVRRAGRPLLLGADLERGAGQQFEGLAELPPPGALAALGDPDVVRWAGAVTGADARSIGVNWVFAPVADLDLLPGNPIVQSRAFGADPTLAARCVQQWVEGCGAVNALSCVKHWPGHGRTTTDSHAGLPVVATALEELRRSDLVPFQAGIAAGTDAVMSAHVAFPALDPTGLPATRSAAVMRLLRQELGFTGLTVTDALIMSGATAGTDEGHAVVEAVRAGNDILLYPDDPVQAHDALQRALDSGSLARDRVDEALARYAGALERTRRGFVAAPRGPYESVAHLADAVLSRGLARGSIGALSAPFTLRVVDDDLGGPYAPSPSGYTAGELEARGLVGSGGSTILLAFAEPRAWKGRSGFSAESRAALARAASGAALVVLFGHPRLVDEIPPGPPVLVAWHRQRLMQEAAARWVAARA